MISYSLKTRYQLIPHSEQIRERHAHNHIQLMSLSVQIAVSRILSSTVPLGDVTNSACSHWPPDLGKSLAALCVFASAVYCGSVKLKLLASTSSSQASTTV